MPESSDEAFAMGFDELIGKPSAITVIEWSDKVKDILKKITYRVKINYIDNHTREVEIL